MNGLSDSMMSNLITDSETGDDIPLKEYLLKQQVEHKGRSAKLFSAIEPTQYTSTSGRWLFVTTIPNYTAAVEYLDRKFPRNINTNLAHTSAPATTLATATVYRPNRPTQTMLNYAAALKTSLPLDIPQTTSTKRLQRPQTPMSPLRLTYADKNQYPTHKHVTSKDPAAKARSLSSKDTKTSNTPDPTITKTGSIADPSTSELYTIKEQLQQQAAEIAQLKIQLQEYTGMFQDIKDALKEITIQQQYIHSHIIPQVLPPHPTTPTRMNTDSEPHTPRSAQSDKRHHQDAQSGPSKKLATTNTVYLR